MEKALSQQTLTQSTYEDGIADLLTRDKDLAAVVLKWGKPPFWTHTPGFPGIIMAILSQQVSLESAQAAFTKLESVIDPIVADEFLSLDDTKLREIGFSQDCGLRDVLHIFIFCVRSRKSFVIFHKSENVRNVPHDSDRASRSMPVSMPNSGYGFSVEVYSPGDLSAGEAFVCETVDLENSVLVNHGLLP